MDLPSFDHDNNHVDELMEDIVPLCNDENLSEENMNIHEDLMKMVKENGLEDFAVHSGLVANGSFQNFSSETNEAIKKQSSVKKRKSATTLAALALSSSSYSGYRGSKGLRHFSLKVCQKVEEKQRTTYSEVADDLVKDFLALKAPDDVSTLYDEKNIRRRVYDALNVLMAINIITKERKEIRWNGLPANAQQTLDALSVEKNQRRKNVEEKQQQLRELVQKQISLRKLMKRNAKRKELSSSRGMQTSDTAGDERSEISLPFVVLSTKRDTIIQCEMSEPRDEVYFNFDAPFEIHDDYEMLKEMGFTSASASELKAWFATDVLAALPPQFGPNTSRN